MVSAEGSITGATQSSLTAQKALLAAVSNQTDIQMVINTPSSGISRFDDKIIRQESYKLNVPVITTIAGARSTIEAMKEVLDSELTVTSLQDYYEHVS